MVLSVVLSDLLRVHPRLVCSARNERLLLVRQFLPVSHTLPDRTTPPLQEVLPRKATLEFPPHMNQPFHTPSHAAFNQENSKHSQTDYLIELSSLLALEDHPSL